MWTTVELNLPIAVLAADTESLDRRRLAQATWILLALGVTARVVRYLLRFPLWDDEAFLCANFLDRGYLDLIQPLDNHQVAPLLFLWVQLSTVKLFGFSEYALRLYPLACGVGGLFLYRHLAGRLLKGTALLIAVGLFAVSYSLIRHSVEAKPYGSDVFVSLVMLTLFIEWQLRGHDARWLWASTAFVPVALGLSYPAVFVGGGISLATGVSLLGARGGRRWLGWAIYNLVLVGSFLGFFVLCTAGQKGAELSFMREYWQDIFPPMTEPLKLLGWLAVTHTSELMAYPVDLGNCANVLTLLCSLVGLTVFLRQRRYAFVVLCLTPLVLNFIAAALQRYPYGGSPRFGLYWAPIICWLTGLGAAVLLAASPARRRRPSLLVIVGLLAAIACGSIFRDFVKPYKSKDVMRERDFARWFWFNKAFDGELICLWSDGKQSYSAKEGQVPIWATYFCNQRIYSLRHAQGRRSDLSRISAAWPLRCVRPRLCDSAADDAALDRWLQQMQTRYELVVRETHSFPRYYRDRDVEYVAHLDVYEFIPQSTESAFAPLPGKSANPVP